MKKSFTIYLSSALLMAAILPSCSKEIGSLNGPAIEDLTTNPTQFQLNNVVVGTEAGLRNNLDFYLDATGVIGREMYRFASSEPRYTSDLLGKGDLQLNNNTFYLTNSWNSRYRAVKDCNILIEGATNSTRITDAQKKGYLGFAKTLKAYELLINLNLTYTNGIRADVSNPDKPGPFLDYENSLKAIADLLNEAKTDLTGAEILFKVSGGLLGGTVGALGTADAPSADWLVKVNRALAARVAAYRKQWPEVLTNLAASFYNPNGDFYFGVYHVYSTGPSDQTNLAYVPKNSAGEIRLAHPSYHADVLAESAADDRANKVSKRDEAASQDDLASDWDVWVYTSQVAPVAIVRNEELMLLEAEAKINIGGPTDLLEAQAILNKIRAGHHATPYPGLTEKPALLNEMLLQRRFSLYFEGHRWVDMRRYDRLNQLPIDRPNDNVFDRFPRPLTEGQ